MTDVPEPRRLPESDDSLLTIRPARGGDGDVLTELALASKGHWGYDRSFLERARAELTIDDTTIVSASIFVLERGEEPVGFYGLVGAPPLGRLEWLFVEPAWIGHGYGRLLWDDALTRARAAGFTELLVESDRYAEGFYLAMGASRIAATVSPVDGAQLPLLRVALRAGAGEDK